MRRATAEPRPSAPTTSGARSSVSRSPSPSASRTPATRPSRSTRPTILIGICNVCHPFYTGQQKFVDTAGRVDKFQQRLAKTQAAQAAAAVAAASKKKRK